MKIQLKLLLLIIVLSLFSCSDDDQVDNPATINKIFAYKIDEGCTDVYDSKLVTLDLTNGQETTFISPVASLSGMTLSPFTNKLTAIYENFNTPNIADHISQIYQIDPTSGAIAITDLESNTLVHYSNLMIKSADSVLIQKSGSNYNQIVEVNLISGTETIVHNLPVNFDQMMTGIRAAVYLSSSNEIVCINGNSLTKINLSSNTITTLINEVNGESYYNLIKDTNDNVYATKINISSVSKRIMKINTNTGSETLIGAIDIPDGGFMDGFYKNNKLVYAAVTGQYSPFDIYELNLNTGLFEIRPLDNTTYSGSYIMDIAAAP